MEDEGVEINSTQDLIDQVSRIIDEMVKDNDELEGKL